MTAYPPEDVFARVPELAAQPDPVLLHLDRLLEGDALFQAVWAELVRRYRLKVAECAAAKGPGRQNHGQNADSPFFGSSEQFRYLFFGDKIRRKAS